MCNRQLFKNSSRDCWGRRHGEAGALGTRSSRSSSDASIQGTLSSPIAAARCALDLLGTRAVLGCAPLSVGSKHGTHSIDNPGVVPHPGTRLTVHDDLRPSIGDPPAVVRESIFVFIRHHRLLVRLTYGVAAALCLPES